MAGLVEIDAWAPSNHVHALENIGYCVRIDAANLTKIPLARSTANGAHFPDIGNGIVETARPSLIILPLRFDWSPRGFGGSARTCAAAQSKPRAHQITAVPPAIS